MLVPVTYGTALPKFLIYKKSRKAFILLASVAVMVKKE
jgi:hypothetical protein